jgi:hypothetical protein
MLKRNCKILETFLFIIHTAGHGDPILERTLIKMIYETYD